METQQYEKLGAFYLGRRYDLDSGATSPEPLLYDSKDLTTHAMCVGMTGSGKTGLCLSLLEEAAIDGVPVIAVDPKGDLGNLLLTFPKLAPGDFAPWVDPAAAQRKGQTPEKFAAATAKLWKEGLASWGQPPERIAKLREAAEVNIYTPGGSAGLPISVLRGFHAPDEQTLHNREALQERIASSVQGLLALLGIDADPIRSREHILLSNILNAAWTRGKSLDLPRLIQEIQQPPFSKIGVLDLETFFPTKDRVELSLMVNNLLASPGFAAWSQGDPLDVQRLLYGPNGKPRISILSIAHLGDSERMFFVTLLLGEVLAWMRKQSGTSSLRAILYMDEIFGYFPPIANPPSKQPMLTLLKQARAFGLGVALCTQNPVDLDYKGLSNCGTWFLGRLQTQRDKERVLEGLEGASAAAGKGFDRARMEAILAGLGSRVFLMNNVHDDEPVVFQTRWALSYLAGPLSSPQIARLMQEKKVELAARSQAEQVAAEDSSAGAAPMLPPEADPAFLAASKPTAGGKLVYRPALFGAAKLHFSRSTYKVDLWRTDAFLVPLRGEVGDDPWEDAQPLNLEEAEVVEEGEEGAEYAAPPEEATISKHYKSWAKDFKDYLYRTQALTVWRCNSPKLYSAAGESEGDFRAEAGPSRARKA